jgi:hypothetical protein
MFKKLSDVPKLFNKISSNKNVIFRKAMNTGRQIDNSVARVGHFLTNTANSLGLRPIGSAIQSGVNAVHNIRNNLEKAIKAPISEIRHSNYA